MTFIQFVEVGLSYFYRTEAFVSAHGEVAVMLLLLVGTLLSSAAGYFCGCFNTAIFVSKKFFGSDIRESGSGNAGMTNMFRVFGKKAGFMTLCGDVLKTVVAVAFGYVFLGYTGAWLSGLFCVLGHMFPFCYKFRGGKGVLCAAVVLLLADWPVFLITIGIFVVVLIGTRMVSMASVMSALLMPLMLDLVYRMFYTDGSLAGIRIPIAIGIMIAVVLGHKDNLKRIRAGTEPKIRMPWDKKQK